MNWEAINAITQIVGGIFIVVSIIYLALQTRLARRYSEASIQSDFTDGWNNTIKGWIESPDTIAILRKGFNNLDNLSDCVNCFPIHFIMLVIKLMPQRAYI